MLILHDLEINKQKIKFSGLLNEEKKKRESDRRKFTSNIMSW